MRLGAKLTKGTSVNTPTRMSWRSTSQPFMKTVSRKKLTATLIGSVGQFWSLATQY